MLAARADAEALKKHHENKEVIDAERGFDGVAGHKFKGGLATLHQGDPGGKGDGGQHQDCGAQPGKGLRMAGFAAMAREQPVAHQQQCHRRVKAYPPNPGDARDHSWMLPHGLDAPARRGLTSEQVSVRVRAD